MRRLLIGAFAILLSADALAAAPRRKIGALRTVTTNGVEWTYTVMLRGNVSLGHSNRLVGPLRDSTGTRLAVPQNTAGDLTIPCILDGKPVRSIASGAFSGCKGLTSVTIPPGVTGIGWGAFRGCSGLKSVTIPPSVTSIASDAFAETPFFDNMPDGMVIIGSGLLLKYKGDCPFAVTIPDGVTSIAKGAFRNCHKMVSVSIPSSVTNIDVYAFSGCSNLASVTIPPSLTKIEDYVFSGCSNLTSVTISFGVKSVGRSSFADCSRLASMTIPPSVTSIGSLAFWHCRGLGVVTIAEGVKRIEDNAFSCCYGLGTVKIPSSMTFIGKDAFGGTLESFEVDERNTVYCSINGLLCSKDRGTLICGINGDVIIPSCVTNIATGAFNGCGGLRSVRIPSSVKIVGGSALVAEIGHKSEFRRLFELMREGWNGGPNLVFGYCSGLLSFVVDEENTAYSSRNGMLCSKDGQTLVCGVNGDVTIPPGVTNIGRSAFYGYYGLKSVKIPSSVTRIEERAFYASWLESLTIPATVTNIDCRAFMSCPNLKTVDVVRDGEIERESAADFFRRFGFTEERQREADEDDERRKTQALQVELKRAQAAKDASGGRQSRSERQ